MCLQVCIKTIASRFLLRSKSDVQLWAWKNSGVVLWRTVFQQACYTTVQYLVHSVCVQVRKTWGDIFHTPHIKVQIFDLEYRRARQSCWKRHSPIYKQGLSDRDVLQREWSRARECGWVGRMDGWGWGVSHHVAQPSRKLGLTFHSGVHCP